MTETTAPAPAAGQRLMSLDALRGFDMFWIIGAESLVWALSRMSPTKPAQFLATQLEHVEWEGFRFYDLIFPLFVFMAGVSLVYSLTRTIAQAGRAAAVKRVFRRGVLLFVIGIIYSGGVSSPWPDMRLMGVLNRIALAYLFAGLLFCFFKPRALVAIAVSLLLGYWAMLALIPIRDIRLDKANLAALAEKAGDAKTAELFKQSGNPSAVKNSEAWAAAEKVFNATTNRVTGKYDKGLNLVNHFDFQYLPARKYDVFFDPEGILSTIPAVVTCLLGAFTGCFLRREAIPQVKYVTLAGGLAAILSCLYIGFSLSRSWWSAEWAGKSLVVGALAISTMIGGVTAYLMWSKNGEIRKSGALVAAGFILVATGTLWGQEFPVIKKIWTSSYVLVAGGYSAMLLGVFYLIVDVWKFQRWCRPFVWIGMNSITVYLASNFIGGFRKLAARLAGGDIQAYLNEHWAKGAGDMLVSVVGLLLMFWLVNFLYRKKIFLRL